MSIRLFSKSYQTVVLVQMKHNILQCTCIKVARYSFSGSVPSKFEHKQRFGKIVLDKDEKLL